MQYLSSISKLGILDIDFKFKPGDVPFPMQRLLWKKQAHKFIGEPLEIVAKINPSMEEAASMLKSYLVQFYQINNDIADIVTQENISDTFFMGMWLKYKQIYKFDKECKNMLAKTNVDKIPSEVFKNLPYDSFYIEANFDEECVGCFVSATISEDKPYLGMEFLRNNAGAEFFTAFIPLCDDVVEVNKYFDESSQKNFKLCKECLTLLLYLCSDNKDVEYVEPRSKKEIQRARKSHNTKVNKVGYRVGSTIRSTKRIYLTPTNHTGSHTPKSPHMRAAHYHHYWTGSKDSKERKLILRFIEPTFIKGGKIDLSTVHKVIK